jgi:hypothetical protein
MAMPGWQSLIVCDPAGGADPVSGSKLPDCDWSALVRLASVLMNDMVIIATFIAVALFAYAGFRMLLAQGSENEFKKAVGMFQKLAWGYLWILIAWIVVYTISNVLLKDGFSILTT